MTVMSFLRSALIAALVALMATVQQAEAQGQFLVVAYVKNLPEHLEAEMENKSSHTLFVLQQYLENCTFVESGGSLTARRELRQDKIHEDGEQVASDEPGLIENKRDRDLFGGCPSSCSKSGSFRCKQMGCAFCGRCGRRRERRLKEIDGGGLRAGWERDLLSSENSDAEDGSAATSLRKPPTRAPLKRPTKRPTKRRTKQPTQRPTKTPTVRPTGRPTSSLTSSPTSKPSSAIDSVVDLLAESVDEDFEDFLKAPGMAAEKIEKRLDTHANYYYCRMQNLTDCRISYKILQELSNGTTYPLTGYPQE
jgi:hypothetical protein